MRNVLRREGGRAVSPVKLSLTLPPPKLLPNCPCGWQLAMSGLDTSWCAFPQEPSLVADGWVVHKEVKTVREADAGGKVLTGHS